MSGVALVYRSTFRPAGLVAPADGTLYSTAVPRPAASSFMPLRKASQHPALPTRSETPRTKDRCMDVASPLLKAGKGMRCGKVKGEPAGRRTRTAAHTLSCRTPVHTIVHPGPHTHAPSLQTRTTLS
jgi:hypothetical protein